jgi:Holliday junction resolvase
MTERDLQRTVEHALRLGAWRYLHVFDSRRSPGAGWPDIFAVRDGEALALELKTATGRVSPEQHEWLAALAACEIDARVVRPGDLDELTTRLLRRRAA